MDKIFKSSHYRTNKFVSFIKGVIRAPFHKSKYGIKRGYIEQSEFHHYSDIDRKDEFQSEVYKIAKEYALKFNIQSIIDVGCGSGYKLRQNFADEFHIQGIEIKSTLKFLKANYPKYSWLDGEQLSYDSLTADMVICADVIEHVINTNELLNNIKSIKDVKLIVISTPERTKVRGCLDYGPPENITHIREWNFNELANYISS